MSRSTSETYFKLIEACEILDIDTSATLRKWTRTTNAALHVTIEPLPGQSVVGGKVSAKYLSCSDLMMIAEVCAPHRVEFVRKRCQAGHKWLERVEPTAERVWRSTYMDQLARVLNVLNNQCLSDLPRHVLVMDGLSGSPRRDMAKAIADYLDLPPDKRKARGLLQPYRRVYVVECRQLVVDMVNDPELNADAVMQPIRSATSPKAGTSADKDRAVLVVDHVNLLLGNATTEHLWQALAEDSTIALIGALDPMEDEHALRKLQDISPRQVETVSVDKTTPQDTYSYLSTHRYDEWQVAGFTFADDAFDDVIALEPGASVNNRRMTLPHLAAEVGQLTVAHMEESVVNFSGGADVLKSDFARALQQVQTLLQSSKTRNELVSCLEIAAEVIRTAADSPQGLVPQDVTSDSGPTVKLLTRAHVSAQLLSSGGCAFRWEDM